MARLLVRVLKYVIGNKFVTFATNFLFNYWISTNDDVPQGNANRALPLHFH